MADILDEHCKPTEGNQCQKNIPIHKDSLTIKLVNYLKKLKTPIIESFLKPFSSTLYSPLNNFSIYILSVNWN